MPRNLPPLIQAMLKPAFYDHPVSQPIQLIQTHISYVLLTGDYAYKIKKQIAFGFLDFTTLALRQTFCEEELRLNKRLSPDLYIAVVAIGGQDNQYTLHQSPAIEYAVKMRQFPQSFLFSQLFKTGQLKSRDFINLAKHIAHFHSTLSSSNAIQRYGDIQTVQSIHENNYQLSEPFIGITQTSEQYIDTKAFTLTFFREHRDWIISRRERVKECHGDLHLNNICRYHGNIQIFDCIEFNQEFRNIDPIYDAAFMVMDLEFQGRADFAYQFLNTYVEETGDYLGVRMMPLYLLMRAYIRGNVNSLALNDSAISSQQREDLKQQAIAYYKLAWSYTQRLRGHVYIMSGLSGSGKSTVAKQIVSLQPAIHIRSDAIRKHIAGIPLTERGAEQELYTPEMTQKTYTQLLETGLALAQEGWTVILDAKYDRQILRENAIAKLTQSGIGLTILHCTADINLIRERLRHRTGDISDATVDLIDAQIETAEGFGVLEQPFLQRVNTDQELRPQLQSILFS